LAQQVRQAGHCAAPQRHRGVSARPAHRCAHPADLLLGYHDRVEAARPDLQREAAELAEGVANLREQPGVLLHKKPRAVVAAVLLVADDAQHHVARQIQPFRLGAQHSCQQHGNAALHVQGAATPDVPLIDDAGKRRVPPVLAGRCYNVHMAVQEQRRRGAAPGEPGDQVRPARRALKQRACDAGCGEQIADVADAGRLGAGRVGRVEADQPLQEFCGSGVDPVRVGVGRGCHLHCSSALPGSRSWISRSAHCACSGGVRFIIAHVEPSRGMLLVRSLVTTDAARADIP
jgi:hypothetical protein